MAKTAADLRREANEAAAAGNVAAQLAVELRREANRLEAQERQAARDSARRELSAKLLEYSADFAQLTDKQHGLIFDKAWEDGHESGHDAIEMAYGELLQFVLDLGQVKGQRD